jgi:hypothetical protein
MQSHGEEFENDVDSGDESGLFSTRKKGQRGKKNSLKKNGF